MINPLSQATTLIQIRPKRNIGGLFFDVVFEETHEDSLSITEHPVEQGASISDHAYKKPMTVAIRAGASDSGTLIGPGGIKRSVMVYEQLLALQATCEPIDITTGKRSYKNMLIEVISTTTDATTENALIVTADCREVIIVRTQVTSVPPRERHGNPGKTGSVSDKGTKQPQAQTTNSSGRSSGLQTGLGTPGGGYKRPGGAAPGYGG
jgi:hypothetical protein